MAETTDRPATEPAPVAICEKSFSMYAEVTKAVKADDGYVYLEGYASTFEEDLYGETVQPEAFKETLADYLRNPIVLANHTNKTENAVGIVTEATADQKGLRVKVRLSNSPDEFTTSVRTKALEGILRAFSIGGLFAYEGVKIVRVKLLEISIVPIPANPGALFSMAKAWESVRQLEPAGVKTVDPSTAPEAESPANATETTASAEPGPDDLAPALVETAKAFVAGVKAGRVLSSKTEAALRQAADLLTGVLSQVDKAPQVNDDGTQPQAEGTQKGAPEAQAPAVDPKEAARAALVEVYKARIMQKGAI